MFFKKWIERVGKAILPCFLLVSMYTLFNPIELVVSSAAYLSYTWHDLIIPILGIFAGTMVVLCALVSLLPKKVFENLIVFIVGVAVASYCQNMFMNPNFGVLDGTAIQWDAYRGEAILNLVIWALILVIPFVLKKRFKSDMLKNGMLLVAVTLIAAQGAGMISILLTSKCAEDRYLSASDNYKVSAKDNIITFHLDNLSNELFDDILVQYPDVRESLKDFTYYDNANCNWRTTFPAMLTWSTGVEYNPTEPVASYFKKAWKDKNAIQYYDKLHQLNYKVNIYAPQYVLTDDISYMSGLVDNIDQRGASVVNYTELPNLYKLAAFRTFPIAMKQLVWVSTDQIQRIVSAGEASMEIQTNHKYISALRKNGLELDRNNNYYIVQYLTGAHSPFRSDENGNYTSDETDELRQAVGYLRAVAEYLEELKRLGVYDDAVIILTADHGAWDRLQFAYCIKEKKTANTEIRISHAPISPQIEHLGTIMALLGQDGYGKTIFDYAENEIVVRSSNYFKMHNDYPSVKKYDADSEGNNNVVYQIDYEGDRTVLNAVYRKPTEIIPIVDSFF